nr:UDP-glucuronate:xylan alpha-glucuronosyltransferase 2 isoform X1 [Tanacetum cinerariifolium]
MLDGKVINQSKQHGPSFMHDMNRGMKIGMVNMDEAGLSEWSAYGETIPILFDKVSENLKWIDLFIGSNANASDQSCLKIPMPDFSRYVNMDMVVVKVPCNPFAEEWQRDVFRLQLHLVVSNMVVKRGKRGAKVVVESKCRPMVEIFRCEDLLKEEGQWWYYEPDLKRLEQIVSLHPGTCELVLPQKGRINNVYNVKKKSTKLEAYATVLHSSESYVCGAITLAQSLLKTGTTHDLILLIDTSISVPKRQALAAAGWTIRIIKRIRSKQAKNNTYNMYNYTKLRLWQLTDYHKIIFIDSDIIVLRNLDHLFYYPQLSAKTDHDSIFNSGVMVIEPSNCTFMHFTQRMNEIISYNGGDQGFLNEIFVHWHILPRNVNSFTFFSPNIKTEELNIRNRLLAADPPQLYAIHYFGIKPWLCYRDYDCNWDIRDLRMYASDVAHHRWWKVHDEMDESLQKHCNLTPKMKMMLNSNRKMAKEAMFPDEHWRINVDSFTCPASFPWHTGKNVSRDPFPKSMEFNADDYATLVARPAPFRKFPEPFLCLIGMSRNYTLDEDNFPTFLHDDGTGGCLPTYIVQLVII